MNMKKNMMMMRMRSVVILRCLEMRSTALVLRRAGGWGVKVEL